MKIEKVLLVAVLAAIMPFIFFSVGYGAVALTHGDALVQKAEKMGKVRVIVTFSVPQLDQLQAVSHTFRSAKRSKAELDVVRSQARAADEALAAAINDAGSSLFGELGLTGKTKHIFKVVPMAVLEVNREELLSLAGHKGVVRVVEDEIVPVPITETTLDDDDDGGGDTTGLSYGVDIINAPEAWDQGFDGSGWYVAVLDTGVRTSHEMFSGKKIVEACFSTNDGSYPATSLCPSGDEEEEGTGSAIPPADAQYDHGSHVAGIAVGDQPGGDLSGVAPGADLIAIQVFSYFSSLSPHVQSFGSDQIQGLEYVYDLRTSYAISSVNMSLGSNDTSSSYCDSDGRKEMIDNLTAAGIAVAIATGNSGSCGGVSAPSCISTAVAVGGSTETDEHYSQNNWHPTMQDIFAPAVDIYSALATGDTDYDTKTGTSMATPHVAGAWAIFRQAAPTATVSELESIMEETGTAIDSGCSITPSFGPRLDVAAVVERYLDDEAAPTANAGQDQTVSQGATVTLDGSASTSHTGYGCTHAWTQTSGTTVSLSDAGVENPSFTAPEVGTGGEQLVFELTVTDNYNALTDTDSVTITVNGQDQNSPPTANAGQDQTVNSGTTVHLDGSGSISNSGGSLYYAWIQTSGVAITLSDPNACEPTFVSPLVESTAALEFELLVIDNSNNLAATDTARITIDHIDSNLDIGFIPATAFEGEIVGFLMTGDGAFVNLTPLDPASVDFQSGGVDTMKYLFDIQIKCSPGATVNVTWQFPREAPHNAVWGIYSAVSGWSYSMPQWNISRKKAGMSLTDSDADGSITLRSGVGYNHASHSDDGWEPGCFVDTLVGRGKTGGH